MYCCFARSSRYSHGSGRGVVSGLARAASLRARSARFSACRIDRLSDSRSCSSVAIQRAASSNASRSTSSPMCSSLLRRSSRPIISHWAESAGTGNSSLSFVFGVVNDMNFDIGEVSVRTFWLQNYRDSQ